MNQKSTIIVLVLGLLAALGAAGVVLYLLPSGSNVVTDSNPPTNSTQFSPTSADTPASTSVLNRQGYKALDQKLIQQGSIPVQPPQGVGKPNPFS